jgi:hypothetical protein
MYRELLRREEAAVQLKAPGYAAPSGVSVRWTRTPAVFTLCAALSAGAVVWNVGEGDEGSVGAAWFLWKLP